MEAFGLIWDGTSVKKPLGTYGEYLKYNNPHKASLYLTAGLPLIVWDDSGVADFVINNKVGITIKSLEEISYKIDEITEAEYQEMTKNAKEISIKLRSGNYLETAIDRIMKGN